MIQSSLIQYRALLIALLPSATIVVSGVRGEGSSGAGPSVGVHVKVFGLQADMWAPPRDDVWVRYNMSLKDGGESSETSICYRVRPATLTSYEVHVSLAESDFMNNALMLYREGSTNGIYYNGNRQYGFPNFTTVIALHQWVHYCHVFSGGHYRAFVDGAERVRGDLHTQVLPLSLNSTLILGQEQDLLAGGYDVLQVFRGHITQVNIWDRVLSDIEVKDIASCRTDINGNIFSSDREEVEVLGASVHSQRLDTLCQRTDEYVIFPEMRSLDESQLLCHRVGYEVFGPRTSESNFKLYEESLQFTKSCSSNFHLWLGLTDEKEEGTWRTFLDDSVIEETSFEVSEPNGFKGENCILMFRPTGLWVDIKCTLKWPACAPCEKKVGMPLRLRGLCHELETETFYEVLGYRAGKPYFHGFYGNMIYINDDGDWEILDTRTEQSLATMTPATENSYPIGRQKWTLIRSVCEHLRKSQVELSLSACLNSEFTCANGDCIPKEGRCDDRDNCSDFSDEEGCTLLLVPKGYRTRRPPDKGNEGEGIEVDARVEIFRFVRVSDVSRIVSMEFSLEMLWKDLRLKYLNLRDTMEWNILTSEEMHKIWRPRIEFPNLYKGDIKLLRDEMYLNKTQDPLDPDFNDVLMDLVYPGSSATVVLRHHYSGSFACSFNVFHYPFDTQECSLLLQMGVRKELVRFSPGRSKIVSYETSELPEYVVGRSWVEVVERGHPHNTFSVLQVRYELQRRWTTTIMSLYCPSLMLLAIGYVTLYIRLDALQVRLVVSLTTMLVLFTLFSNTSDALPSTAYVKMIDVWLFSCFFILFFIIILHVGLELLPSKVMPQGPRAWEKTRKEWTQAWVVTVVRRYVLPLILLVFSLVYWSVLFYYAHRT